VAEVAGSRGKWLQVAELDVGFVAFALSELFSLVFGDENQPQKQLPNWLVVWEPRVDADGLGAASPEPRNFSPLSY
jgi:hypothetical protein